MRFFSLIFIFICPLWCSCQESAVKSFFGFYNGVNLQIECKESPITPWQKCDCIDSVSLNKKTLTEPLIDGVQVNINNFDSLKIWSEIDVKVFYSKTCQIRILNPYHFYPQELKTVDSIYFDYPILKWETDQNYPDLRLWVQIEQFKWGEWVKVGSHINIGSEKSYKADISSFSTSGENTFRVAVSNIEYDHFPSSPIVFENKIKKKAKFKKNKKSKLIQFNQELDYILYNEKKEIVKRGMANQLSLENITGGIYYLYYSNRIKKIKLKD